MIHAVSSTVCLALRIDQCGSLDMSYLTLIVFERNSAFSRKRNYLDAIVRGQEICICFSRFGQVETYPVRDDQQYRRAPQYDGNWEYNELHIHCVCRAISFVEKWMIDLVGC